MQFKIWLTEDEVRRNYRRSSKLINYIANRHDRDKDEIPFKNYNYTGSATPMHKRDKHKFKFLGTQQLDMKDLYPGQQFFSHTGIRYYLDPGNYNFRNPIVAVKYPHMGGKIVIHDGHHRWLTNKIKGIKMDDVNLYEPTEHWKLE